MSIAMAEEAVNEVAQEVTNGRLRLDIGNNLLDAALGYLVVFIGLALLMCVVIFVGKVMTARKPAQNAEKTDLAPAAAPDPVKKELAPGSAGEVKIYDTDPRDAAMIMAIVADKLQKPLNELRFISIKEVKE